MIGRKNMIKVVTLQHIYGKNRERMTDLLKTLVENELKDLEVKVEISITPENWAEFSLEGEDEEVSANFLISRYGTPAVKAEAGKIYLVFFKLSEKMLFWSISAYLSRLKPKN